MILCIYPDAREQSKQLWCNYIVMHLAHPCLESRFDSSPFWRCFHFLGQDFRQVLRDWRLELLRFLCGSNRFSCRCEWRCYGTKGLQIRGRCGGFAGRFAEVVKALLLWHSLCEGICGPELSFSLWGLMLVQWCLLLQRWPTEAGGLPS